jgi:hypothetical protein
MSGQGGQATGEDEPTRASRTLHETGQDGCMEMTGWLSGQIFFQTVDQDEAQQINAFLATRGIMAQTLTQSEHLMLDPADPASGVTSDRFSVAVQLAGFPQVISPVLDELIQRAHGRGWQPDDGSPAV